MRGESKKRVGPLLVAALALAGCKSLPFKDDPSVWSNNNPSIGHPIVFDVEWWTPLVSRPTIMDFALTYQPSETAQPAVDPDSGRIVVCTKDGYVRSLSPDKGRIEWEKKLGGRCFAGGKIKDGVLYMPAGDGSLYALRARTGEEIWKYVAGEELVTLPILIDGKLLVASQNDTLFVIDAATGKWIWQQRRDTPSGFTLRGSATPRVQDGVVYMGYADGSLVALKLEDGAVLWERNLSASGGNQFIDVDTSPVVDASGHVFGASFKDGIYSLDTKTGDIAWTTASSGVTSLIPRGDVLFTTGDGQVGAVHSQTGRALWKIDLSAKGKRNASGREPLLSRELLFVPTSAALVIVDTSTGKVRYAWDPGKGVTATPTQAGRRVYVLSNLGTLFALRLRGG
jgi:outer membrane protein assembly factor BamB